MIDKIKDEKSEKLDLENNFKNQDLGFEAFKLQKSNLKIWRSVANYRSYDSSGNPVMGKFAKWFEEIYNDFFKVGL